MVFVKACSAKDVKPGKMKGVKAGGKDILVANLGGRFYAIGNICTHMSCRLSGGKIEGEGVLCPCHASLFDLKTGRVLGGPASAPEPLYKVRIEGNDILVDA
jgi:3-phenylpropionate/trans-cinnamate dioxygenase ferredoxin subunit